VLNKGHNIKSVVLNRFRAWRFQLHLRTPSSGLRVAGKSFLIHSETLKIIIKIILLKQQCNKVLKSLDFNESINLLSQFNGSSKFKGNYQSGANGGIQFSVNS